MRLKDLTLDERIALVGLLELVVESDARVSAAESERIAAVAAEIGEAAYHEAAREVDRLFHDEDALKAFLTRLERQEARELIYGTVFEAAIPDAIDSRESKLLEWLARTWRLTVRLAGPISGA